MGKTWGMFAIAVFSEDWGKKKEVKSTFRLLETSCLLPLQMYWKWNFQWSPTNRFILNNQK